MVSFERAPTSPTSITSEALEELWICDGIDEAATVQALGWQLTPPAMATYMGIFYRQEIRVERVGYMLHNVAATYGKIPKSKWTWSANTGGGTFTIKTSREHIASYVAAGQVAKNHQGAINRQPDGTIEGAPIVIPSMKFSITIVHPLGIVTPAWAKHVHEITGMVNSTPFLNWAPGEVLFLGGSMSDGSEAEATATYEFAMERNLQNAIIGGITVAEKQGHDFAWIEFRPAEVGGQAVTVPRQIDVCRVYDRTDLIAGLGL